MWIEIGINREEAWKRGIAHLPKENIYSPCCDRIMKFTAKSNNQQSGFCSCGKLVTEYKNGTLKVC